MAGKKSEKTPGQRIEQFKDMLGEVPDEKVAEMADVPVEAVVAFRSSLEAPKAPEPPDAPPVPPEAQDGVGATLDAATLALAKAAEALLAQGYTWVEGLLVPPTSAPVPKAGRQIQLTQSFDYRGFNMKGKPVTIRLAASLYRGEMAEKVIEIAEREGKGHLIVPA